MKLVHRFENKSNEEATQLALELNEKIGVQAIVLSNFDVIAIERHKCLICNPPQKKEQL